MRGWKWISSDAEKLFNDLGDEITRIQNQAIAMCIGPNALEAISRESPDQLRREVEERVLPLRDQMAGLAAGFTVPPEIVIEAIDGVTHLVIKRGEAERS